MVDSTHHNFSLNDYARKKTDKHLSQGWTSFMSIHWVVPLLAGLPFGIGLLLIFMALLNYLTDHYATIAASVLATATCTRSIFGAGLPFLTQPMYNRLGVHWASSLLGFLTVTLSVLPFVYLRWWGKLL